MFVRKGIGTALIAALMAAGGCGSGTDKRLTGHEDPCKLLDADQLGQIAKADLHAGDAQGPQCSYNNADDLPVVTLYAGVPGVPDPDDGSVNPDMNIEDIDVDGVTARQGAFKDRKDCTVGVLLDPDDDKQAFAASVMGDDACGKAKTIASKVLAGLPG